MAKIIITEKQEKELIKILKEESETYNMPVDKKANKPYCINPEKVKIVKKYLDKSFKRGTYEKIGPNGQPQKIRIVAMVGSNGDVLKNMYLDQLEDLLIDNFQNMFSDKLERQLFMHKVLEDWFNDKISIFGNLSVNRLMEFSERSNNMLNEVTSEEIEIEARNVDENPTEKQREAGNYKKGHISIKGMRISIENPKGSKRHGTDDKGNKWEVEMKDHYGYFRDTDGNGKDGDAVDCFIGPNPDDFDTVFVVDQKINGEFDESKALLGYKSKEEAHKAYLRNYSPGWKGFWKITAVSIPVFKKWLYRKHKQRKPFSEYVYIMNNKS